MGRDGGGRPRQIIVKWRVYNNHCASLQLRSAAARVIFRYDCVSDMTKHIDITVVAGN